MNMLDAYQALQVFYLIYPHQRLKELSILEGVVHAECQAAEAVVHEAFDMRIERIVAYLSA